MKAIKEKSNLKMRLISALLLAPFVLGFIYLGGVFYKALLLLVYSLILKEWLVIVNKSPEKAKWGWYALGIFYSIIPCLCLMKIRDYYSGLEITLWMILCVWATDIGAYFFGKSIGGAKLAPRLSPKKTWAGLFGGVISSILIGYIFSQLCAVPLPMNTAFNCAMLAILGQVGDLLESSFKRYFGVKDSGNIIPGHGGIMDRTDSFTIIAIYVNYLLHI